MKITTVINYCTNDYRFIKHCIDNVRSFSSEIIVPVSDCFLDGTPENRELLDKTYQESTGVSFIEYEWTEGHEPRYWHNMSRWIGIQNCSTEWILFLDTDEIVESKKFSDWLAQIKGGDIPIYEFSTYWYFRDITNRATTQEHCGLLVKKDLCSQELMFTENERWSFMYTNLPKSHMQNGLDGKPMIHHYSWVRTYDEMLRKVKGWGHTKDRDWTSMVHEEFKKDFDGTDFVHNYQYEKVKGYIDESSS